MSERKKRCQECQVLKYDVYNGMCEDCEQDFEYCTICHEWQHFQDQCRHIFWVHEHGQYEGAGSWNFAYEKWVPARSIFAVLDKTGIAHPLRRAILAQKEEPSGKAYAWNWQRPIWTFLIAPMNGGGGIYEFRLCGTDYGYRFTDALTADQEEAMSDGVNWLESLVDARLDALDATLAVVDEWIAAQERHACLMAMHQWSDHIMASAS